MVTRALPPKHVAVLMLRLCDEADQVGTLAREAIVFRYPTSVKCAALQRLGNHLEIVAATARELAAAYGSES